MAKQKRIDNRMRYMYSRLKDYSLLFSFIFITACNGQDKTHAPQDHALDSLIRPGDITAKRSQQIKQPSSDRLFFIDGQLCQHVRRIFQDKSGNLWFGTNVYNLMRYNGDTLEYFSEKDGLGGGRITGIVEDRDANVWFGTYGGLTRYDGHSFRNFVVQDGLIDNNIWSLIIDRNGILWLGTLEGVIRFDGNDFTSFPIPQAEVKEPKPILSHRRVSCIIEDKMGNLWFGTDSYGICIYNGKSFTHLTKSDGLCDNNIHDLMEDSQGNIWIGTMYGGLSRYDGRSFSNFTENGVISGKEVGGFCEDKSGNIWFAAENFGVYRFNGTSFANFNTEDGLNSNGILCIFEDNEGRFWLGGWGGLFRYNGTSFFSVTKDGPWAE